MSEERRERDIPAEAKAGGRKRSDHPLLQFFRSMREFRGGIADLHRIAERLGQHGKGTESRAQSQAGIRRMEQRGALEKASRPERRSLPPGEKALRSERHVLPAVGRHNGRSSNLAKTLRQFVGPAPRLPLDPPSRRPFNPLRETPVWKHVYGPEDKEAVRHLTESGLSGTFEDLPRAARVAMTVEADRIFREEGRHDRIVGFLATAARSGKPEIAANFSPRKLERMLSGLLGGPQKMLQALWTPEVARIVERYQTERKIVQDRLQTLERGLPEERSAVASPILDARPARALPPVSAEARSVPAPRAESRAVEALFRRNDLLHLRTHGERRQQQIVQAAAGRSERVVPETGVAGGRSEIPLPAENTHLRRASAPSVEESRGRTDDRRKLEGTLTLVGENGETIGSAVLRGSDRNG